MDALTIIRLTMNEFSEVPEDVVKVYISLAEPLVSQKRFGKVYPQGVAFLAAHKMKLNGFGTNNCIGDIGDRIGLSSISEGEVSVSFNSQTANTVSDAEYGLTVYGIQFLQLRRNCIVPIISSGEGSCYGL